MHLQVNSEQLRKVDGFYFYLAMPVFSCGMRTISCNIWNLAPPPGIEPRPPAVERGILARGPPGKSQ